VIADESTAIERKMNNGLTTATENERMLSLALIAVAATVGGGLFTLWRGLVAGLTSGGSLSANIVICVVFGLLGLSMFFGGRGVVWGPKHSGFKDRFNLQALTGALAIALIFLVGGIIVFTAEPSSNEKFADKLTVLDTRVNSLGKDIDGVANQVSELKSKLNGIETSLGKLDRSSADHTAKLNEADAGLKSLVQRIEKLEKDSNRPAQ
jgi:hypothetical protein